MRLPDHIYEAVKGPFAHHASWHAARRPENDHLRRPGTPFEGLKALNEPGSGEEFLRFHREMVRVFKWLAENTPGPDYTYQPWDGLPPWLEEQLRAQPVPWDLAEVHASIDRLAKGSSADELGNFIEGTAVGAGLETGAHIHNSAHVLTHTDEVTKQGADHPGLVDAGMDDPATAHHNEHFWGLHGWIDAVFASWQRENDEEVDQSPLPPDDSNHLRQRMHHVATIELSTEDRAWRFPAVPPWASDHGKGSDQ